MCGKQEINTMVEDSISAYDLPDRVASYDADMEIMHPNRSKMANIALEVLPYSSSAPITCLELGTGTGFLTKRFLEQFPNSRFISIDGAESMVMLAQARIGSMVDRVDFRIADLRQLNQIMPRDQKVDIVLSAYSLHHLSVVEKTDVIRQALRYLNLGGWFVNCDIVISESQYIESRIQELRVKGIIERGRGRDERFRDLKSTRDFLDNLESNEIDQPVTLATDLQTLREAGLTDIAVFWLEYREAVYGGRKDECNEESDT
jgi:ubiquinone/menaquinone biosynthesis C-methylase UbiE